MHRTSLAPLLSATRSRVSCCITSTRPLENFDEAPALGLRQRTGLLHADAVADVEVVLLVVDVELLRALERLAVQGMTHPVDNGHDRGLVHGRGQDRALPHLARVAACFGLVSHRPSPSPRGRRSHGTATRG